MNWTSTQHPKWQEECRAFAKQRNPFRLDHVFGPVEKEFCNSFCAQHQYRQEPKGSSISFTPKVLAAAK